LGGDEGKKEFVRKEKKKQKVSKQGRDEIKFCNAKEKGGGPIPGPPFGARKESEETSDFGEPRMGLIVSRKVHRLEQKCCDPI